MAFVKRVNQDPPRESAEGSSAISDAALILPLTPHVSLTPSIPAPHSVGAELKPAGWSNG